MTAAALLEMLKPELRLGDPGPGKRQPHQDSNPRPCSRRRAMEASRAISSGRRMPPANCRRFWSCTRTAASIRTSRTWRAGWRSANFIAFAPDGLTLVGGYPGDDEKGGEAVRQGRSRQDDRGLLAAAEWLKARPDCTGKLGAVGFCFGGGVVNTLAVRMGADLAAGSSVLRRAAERRRYGQDQGAAACALRRARYPHHVRLAGVRQGAHRRERARIEGYVYAGANHGFHNDTTPRYDEAAAKLAWQRTLDWFDKYLR